MFRISMSHWFLQIYPFLTIYFCGLCVVEPTFPEVELLKFPSYNSFSATILSHLFFLDLFLTIYLRSNVDLILFLLICYLPCTFLLWDYFWNVRSFVDLISSIGLLSPQYFLSFIHFHFMNISPLSIHLPDMFWVV